MSALLKRSEWLYQFLASKTLALTLFLVLCISLIPRTFSETPDIFLGRWGTVLFGLMGLNLLLCTLRRIGHLPVAVIMIHAGTLLTFAGVVISSFGYVATVNIYEGTSVDRVYRWDKEKDMPLGINLAVKKIHVEYYPIPLRVGVLMGEDKVGLFELKTGESFSLDGYTVTAESLEFPSQNLRVGVYNHGHFVGFSETGGERNLPGDFPYDFRLVAFQNPSLKRLWVDLVLSRDGEVLAEGTSEVNSPLTWEKLSFYNTKVDVDQYGNPYAGIQITCDPGLYFVYLGFIVAGIGSVLFIVRKLYGYR